MVLRFSVAAALFIGFTVSLPIKPSNAQQPAAAKPSSTSQAAQNTGQPGESANALVKTTVQNELKAIDNDHTHWMYLTHTRKNGAMITEQIVETPHGNLTRIIARNGHPLSTEEQKQEDIKVEKFVNDTDAQQKQRQDLHNDAKKTQSLLAMLPDALTYTYAGRVGANTKLTFKPNPDFHPPSREAKVFAAMEGQMVINTREHRLVGFSGHLSKPVKFGGGLLGDLDAGGTFDVHQQEVGPGHWEISLLKVNIKGRALLFKTISEQQYERDTTFKRIPDDLTMAQAYDLAKKQNIPTT
ncbi:MAG TPA: hypothetical protein VMD97_03685 [Candidatus Aquilonibacter sp.]|nr:hypothetical protein [Candidatus Aquilonibacter sp.]